MDKLKHILQNQKSLEEQAFLRTTIRNEVISHLIRRRLQRKKRLQILSNLILLSAAWSLLTFFVVFSNTVFNVQLSESQSVLALVFAASLVLLSNVFQQVLSLLKVLRSR